MKKKVYYIFAYWHDIRWKKFVGASIKIWDFSTNLASFGEEVVLFLPKYGFDKKRIPFKVIEIPFINFPIIRFLSFNISLIFILGILSWLKKPDIIYVRRMNSFIPALYAKLRKIKFFFEINDDPFKRDYHEGWKSIFRLKKILSIKLDELNIKFCDNAFIITESLSEKILKFSPKLDKSKFIIMPSGSNVDIFRPLTKAHCRSKLCLDHNKKIVGFAGSLLKHQGIDTLIDSAPSIVKKEPEIFFIIIGEGPMKKIWKDRIKRIGFKKYFMFTGQVDYVEMPIWIATMDICLAPFLRSAGLRSPVKIFDYMACGKPVIASEIPGTTDIFFNSRAIKLIEPENSDALAETVLYLLNNIEEIEIMGQEGRLFIEKNFNRCEIAKKITDQINLDRNH
jgi:glycosyltransferase involved in cell wall biosynthesis